jgi:tight adherence protein B
MLERIVFAVFAAAFLSTIAVYLVLREKVGIRNRRIRGRLNDLATEAETEQEFVYPIIMRDDKVSGIPTLNRILSKFRLFQNLQRLINQSGVPMKAGALVLAILSLGGLSFLLVSAFLDSLLFALAFAFIAGSLPYFYIRRKRAKRREEFESFLPEALDLMTNALKSGFSLESALKMVAREIADPVGIEFGIAFEEQNLGASLTDALSNMGKRVQSDELNLMITALLIHKKVGGNLAEILERIGTTIRERFRLEREVKIHSAYGRLSGVILVLLPIIVAIIIFVLNPEYLKVLWVEKIGRYFVGIAIIMQIIGIWVINRIVNIRI